MPDEKRIQEHLRAVVLARFDQDEARRREALKDFVTVAMPTMMDSAERMAELVPPLLPSLYRRWASMFASRLLQTVPVEQLELLCDGSEENDAAIVLAYVMFMESERMEKQVAEDMASLGLDAAGGNEEAEAAAAWVRERLAASSGVDEEELRRKAKEYKDKQ